MGCTYSSNLKTMLLEQETTYKSSSSWSIPSYVILQEHHHYIRRLTQRYNKKEVPCIGWGASSLCLRWGSNPISRQYFFQFQIASKKLTVLEFSKAEDLNLSLISALTVNGQPHQDVEFWCIKFNTPCVLTCFRWARKAFSSKKNTDPVSAPPTYNFNRKAGPNTFAIWCRNKNIGKRQFNFSSRRW